MNRLPNPPKLPTISAAETRGQLGLKVRGILAVACACISTFGPGHVAAWAEEAEARETASDCPGRSVARERPGVGLNVVVFAPDATSARAIRDHAEATRREVFVRLLDEPSPRPWLIRCEIHVHATPESFADAVGGPPVDSRGATSLEFSGDTVSMRRIDVMGDGPGPIPDALDHELVHVVLADHFVHAPPPRWADEGLALLFDAPEKQRRHEEDFQRAARSGQALSAADLVTLEDYPADGARQRAFYGQSASLVRWLVARRDAVTFIRFLDDCDRDGIDVSLRRHFALDSLDSVSLAWKEVAPINTLGRADLRRDRLP